MTDHWIDTPLTPQDMHDWGCCEQDDCYSLAGIEELVGARFTLLDVLRAGAEGRIPPEDALWVLLYARSPIPARVRAMLACDYAEHVLPSWEEWARHHASEDLDRPRRRIAAARAELRGEGNWDEVVFARRRLDKSARTLARTVAAAAFAESAAAAAAESAAAAAAAAFFAESAADAAAAESAAFAAADDAAAFAADAAAAFAAAAGGAGRASEAGASEHQWQVERAIEVLEEEHKR